MQKTENYDHTQNKKRQTTETDFEVAQMLQLAYTGFKAAIINIFKGVKETMSEELKEGMQQYLMKQKISKKRQKLFF